MNRGRNKGIFLTLAVLLLCALIFFFMRFQSHSNGRLGMTMQSAVTDPKGFVKREVNGGIGVALTTDSATGLPKVNMVLFGSPAEIAGLRAGDIITQVNDTPTAGKSLAQVAESIRGFTLGAVSIAVRRGTSNMKFVLHRSSWNAMGVTNVYPPNTNPIPALPFSPATNAPVP